MGRITVFLLAITVYAFGAMITSVKAGELDAFRIQSGNKNQTVTLAQVKKVLTGKKGCLYKRGYVKFKSNDMTKDLCNQAKGLGCRVSGLRFIIAVSRTFIKILSDPGETKTRE